jgi:hypothetical protein
MKKFLGVFLCMIFFVSGCARPSLTEKEFSAVWGEYLQREFEEGFDEKQSISQREKLLKEVCSRYSIDYGMLKQYMMKNHGDKYRKIYLNQ